MKKLIIRCSVDLYAEMPCCGYKRECQAFAKILHMLKSDLGKSLHRSWRRSTPKLELRVEGAAIAMGCLRVIIAKLSSMHLRWPRYNPELWPLRGPNWEPAHGPIVNLDIHSAYLSPWWNDGKIIPALDNITRPLTFVDGKACHIFRNPRWALYI